MSRSRQRLCSPMPTFAESLLRSSRLAHIEKGCSSPFSVASCFQVDRPFMVAQWYGTIYDTVTRRRRPGSEPCLSLSGHGHESISGHLTTRWMSPQRLRSPILTFATKKLTMMRVGWRRGRDADRTQFFIAVRWIKTLRLEKPSAL